MPDLTDRFRRHIGRLNMRLGLYTPRIDELCLLIGSMKSGTTFLYRHLVQHPRILANLVRKEPKSLLDPEIDDAAYFRQWMPTPFTRQVALEGSTAYSKYPGGAGVVERIRRLPCRVSLIYMVRDPVDRIESQIAHNISRQRKVERRITVENLRYEIQVSNYAMQLDRYVTAMPETPLMVIDFDDIRTDPQGLLRRTCRFLRIEEDFPFRMLGPQNRRRSDHGAGSFRLPEDTRAEIREVLAADMRRFGESYGIDVGKWGFRVPEAAPSQTGAGGLG